MPLPRTAGTERDAWHAELAARFAARRCGCGAAAMSVWPGSDEVRSQGGILLCAAVPDRSLCLEHALPVRRAA